ncbi:hypothetical protein CO115_05010 [Candidatus Falkowbacteria bacterium CG_4_9_14_3_um_filter_36_9]|uniref:Uncharacterized protein n=1 Tax=Candidatus Falkowbacteria bacterium CG02_land_8_20_14_3_00_36_14 TaxID=1974560 RepID=A0A2M7DKC6_9BACT|nr:MAG: hypothetical protein COS18_05705 [Candidatus Falkowbacteria bacterium CG02_land_8_20_14_3_00_36_14]PIX12023.1 MAG: hypothetical protein COZ73_01215 [Candidatus Falkowbacteria bacterium CG_4_8_14_3_um_filter_36_11]PJA11148.1 MAG: hypothetical protein COX67_01325 [Candidatus Falkowbacteria bacterium CG_4_10_14_0_2_um_filter_36_22]PJB18108.1 MAG: hypothetical protein CO115_05010 [Candidatus Falkowbacteria bacterium CG_4_9_14_3_um_filter_36_9]
MKRIRSFGFWAFTPNSSALCPKQNKQNLILFLAKLQSSAEDCNDVEKGEKDINPPNPLYTKGAEKNPPNPLYTKGVITKSPQLSKMGAGNKSPPCIRGIKGV